MEKKRKVLTYFICTIFVANACYCAYLETKDIKCAPYIKHEVQEVIKNNELEKRKAKAKKSCDYAAKKKFASMKNYRLKF